MDKKVIKEITPMEEDFAKWYTDVVKKAELIDYSSVRGCTIIRPYGYAIWENMKKDLDDRFKSTGHENVYMPMFIPESLLQKEKDHVQGFAPEVAWVTKGGSDDLTERLCVRPTSEVLFCEHYSNIINSYRDLPKLYNQWCSVVRWEKTTRPFLRSLEFLWQEGHTIHASSEEAIEETRKMLDVYEQFCRETLNIPVLKGEKTQKEKFAGAISTYTIEALMHNGVALQSGTSHYFGDGFARAFDIKFTSKDNKFEYPHQTSWGVSTRLIGAIIMTHGDDRGLLLPPKIAPIQVVIVPIGANKDIVKQKCFEITEKLDKSFRVKADFSNNSPGWKFSEYEMKGVPIRLEVGPRDIEKNQCVIVRRDTLEKEIVDLTEIESYISKSLDDMCQNLYNAALENQISKTYDALDLNQFTEISESKSGLIRAMWCGDVECENFIKDKFGISSRLIPFEQEKLSDKCVCCEKGASKLVYWGKSY